MRSEILCQTISIAWFVTVLDKFARYDDTRRLSGKHVYKDSEVLAGPLVIRRDKFIILLASLLARSRFTLHCELEENRR